MKRTLCLLLAAVILLALCACGSEGNQPAATAAPAKKEGPGAWNYFTYPYTNANGEEAEINYGVYIPASYDGSAALPLITYIPDSTYVGTKVTRTSNGECPKYWVTEEKQAANPAFFLIFSFSNPGATVTQEGTEAAQIVPIIDKVVAEYGIDENRLYLTGQSMGGIMDFALNDAYPDKFAATLYVGCQPGGEVHDEQYEAIVANKQYEGQKFAYIASALDQKAPYGQSDLMAVLDADGIAYGLLEGIDHKGGEATNSAVQAVLDQGYSQNFFRFKQVTDNGNGGQEHMQSFQYAYQIDALYDWLLAQSK